MSEITQYVYGPVPSRRLGQSLGVDPIPFKTCNYNCVYCQLGRTIPLTCERGLYVPPDDILVQVQEALEARETGDIDYVTLVGQGEPTLNEGLGRIIEGIAEMTEIPIAVITNGALLHTQKVRKELMKADVVMPSLDAADDKTFRRLNRPCPRLHIEEIIGGMAEFSRVFNGQLWIEVMLCKGLNDGEASLCALHEALGRISPDRIQINVPVRPPAEPWIEIPDDETVMRATALLGDVSEAVAPYEGSFSLDSCHNLVDAVFSIIRRHPMREARLLDTLTHYGVEDIEDTLVRLEKSGHARRRSYYGEVFWESTQVRVGD